jgi:hypothetical protein
MQHQDSAAEFLDQIRALNHLFLNFLQASLRGGSGDLGLPTPLQAAARSATPRQIETIAGFPRALFALKLDRVAAARAARSPDTAFARSREALHLTILLTAWNLSRRSEYAARLFLALEPEEVRRLRTLCLEDLPRLSHAPELVGCACTETAALWGALFSENAPALRPQLALIALQPDRRAYSCWRTLAASRRASLFA